MPAGIKRSPPGLAHATRTVECGVCERQRVEVMTQARSVSPLFPDMISAAWRAVLTRKSKRATATIPSHFAEPHRGALASDINRRMRWGDVFFLGALHPRLLRQPARGP